MRRLASLAILIAVTASGASAEESATAEEAVNKVREAAIYLSEEGDAGLGAFADRNSPYIWKDSYVFVFNCDEGLRVANPNPGPVAKIAEIEDAKGKLIGPALCEAAEKPEGGWVEYDWPKLGGGEPVRKVTYMMQVRAQPYQVGAGAYNDSHTAEELEALLKGD